jgi:hypothetical protein
MKSDREKFVLKSRVALLQRKGWSYLRYLHMREALKMMKDCETFLFVGAGYGFAEVVLAAENPTKRFIVTDTPANTFGFARAREWVERGRVLNVEFAALNIMGPEKVRRADAVLSVEVLEYVANARLAAKTMLSLSTKATFCLTAFDPKGQVGDAASRERAVVQGRTVAGFNKADLRALFGSSAQVRGAYWGNAGVLLRTELESMEPALIKEQAPALLEEAARDLQSGSPGSTKEAQAIKALVRL